MRPSAAPSPPGTADTVRLVARLWWSVLRRSWRESGGALVVLAAVVVVHGVHTLRAPEAGRAAYLSLLSAAALGTAVLLPIQMRAAGVLDARRLSLLPLRPAALLLARPLFGSPLRAVLVAVSAAWGAVGVAAAGLGAGRTLLEWLQLAGWAAVAVAAAELLDGVLRRGASFPLRAATSIALMAALLAFTSFGRLWAGLGAPHGVAGPGAALLLGSRAAPAHEAGAALASLAALAALVLAARASAARFAALPPRPRGASSLAGPVAALARLLAPARPAALAKELGCVVRVSAFWVAHLWVVLLSAAAFAGGNPPLLAAAFGLWLAAPINLLGPDVPLGGLVRHALLPRGLGAVLPLRHAAIMATAALEAVAALAVVTALGGLDAGAAARAPAFALWFAYGASLFLLFTVAGDRLSVRSPAPVAVRSRGGAAHAGRFSAGLLTVAALVVTGGVAAAGLVAASVVAASAGVVDGPARTAAVAGGAALLNLLLYALPPVAARVRR